MYVSMANQNRYGAKQDVGMPRKTSISCDESNAPTVPHTDDDGEKISGRPRPPPVLYEDEYIIYIIYARSCARHELLYRRGKEEMASLLLEIQSHPWYCRRKNI
jgi:hypothetical protein